jgi:hypothetical protein
MAKKNNNTAKRKTNGEAPTLPAALQKRNVEEVAGRLAATPITVMRKFSEELDRLFEDFGGRGWLTPMLDKAQLPEGPWSPKSKYLNGTMNLSCAPICQAYERRCKRRNRQRWNHD